MDQHGELMLGAEGTTTAFEAASRPRGSVRVLMAAGGTGGHIFPALAVAEELQVCSGTSKSDGLAYETVFLGTGRGLEARLIPEAGYPLEIIKGAGLKGIRGRKRFRNLMTLPQSALEAGKVLRNFHPNVVVGMGGYISGPVMLEAALVGIPTLLFEPNAVPGFTNRVLAPVVRLAAVGFEESLSVYGTKAHFTGHPVRREFFKIVPKAHSAPFTILIAGGSQGARALNQCLIESLPLFQMDGGNDLRFIHQTGEADYNVVRAAYDKQGIRAEVSAFIDRIAETFSRADLIVCRAGATTVAELAAAGKASILVPYPSATDQHQLQNSRALERVGGAQVIEQKDLTPQRLVREIWDLLRNPRNLGLMEQKARSMARPGAARHIADLVEELGRKTQSA
ncbi:MAG: undecaprenyldiphospho-muramoylpentapeptide beta-N-acetylglucosaminyltransferase [Acidobacteria bacterium]|nr:undecaprenyldiphospho-muramoylpentapeptide beta-N-acetylglucosaminyltransferase [Acidobacteriota bacterium]